MKSKINVVLALWADLAILGGDGLFAQGVKGIALNLENVGMLLCSDPVTLEYCETVIIKEPCCGFNGETGHLVM
jgi:hypothetical protein